MGGKWTLGKLSYLMKRWTPAPLTRALIIFLHASIYFAVLATGASFFFVVDRTALLPLTALALVLGIWASSRVFVQIEGATLCIGSFHPILPRVFSVPISTISAIRLSTTQGTAFMPPFLEIIRDNQSRTFSFGWLSPNELQQIVDFVETVLRKRNN